MMDWTQMRSAEQIAAEADAVRRAAINAAVDAHVDAVARDRGYASAAHLASYAVSTVETWAAEARAFVAWRDAVWIAAFPMIEVGESADDMLAKLPVFEVTA